MWIGVEYPPVQCISSMLIHTQIEDLLLVTGAALLLHTRKASTAPQCTPLLIDRLCSPSHTHTHECHATTTTIPAHRHGVVHRHLQPCLERVQ